MDNTGGQGSWCMSAATMTYLELRVKQTLILKRIEVIKNMRMTKSSLKAVNSVMKIRGGERAYFIVLKPVSCIYYFVSV